MEKELKYNDIHESLFLADIKAREREKEKPGKWKQKQMKAHIQDINILALELVLGLTKKKEEKKARRVVQTNEVERATTTG